MVIKKYSSERSSMVEYQLPKLVTGVRFPSLAPSQSVRQGIEACERRPMGGKGLRPTANELATQASSARRSSRFPSLAPYLLGILILSFLSGCATAPKKSERPVTENKIPGALYHTVRRGDTLWNISRQYGVHLQDLIKANPVLFTNATIENGQLLLIPREEHAEPLPTTEITRLVPGESFTWPVRGMLLTSFGATTDKIISKGIDIKAPSGAGVRASRSGKVVYIDQYLKGFGKTVILDHGDRYQTVYSYNSDILVNVGDQVAQNAVIAKVGRTGRAKDPTLHFEIRRDGEPQNPFYYLPR